MTDYRFTADDNRLGAITSDAIVFPELDMNGQAYTKVNASTKSLGNGRFVVIPPGMDKPEHTYVIEGSGKSVKSTSKDS